MKHQSDIFICKLREGRLLGLPEPVRRPRRRVRDPVPQPDGRPDRDRPRRRPCTRNLKLAPEKKGVVTVNGNAPPGLHQYRAEVKLGGGDSRAQREGAAEGAARHCGRAARLRRRGRRSPSSCGAARRPRSSSIRRAGRRRRVGGRGSERLGVRSPRCRTFKVKAEKIATRPHSCAETRAASAKPADPLLWTTGSSDAEWRTQVACEPNPDWSKPKREIQLGTGLAALIGRRQCLVALCSGLRGR